MAKYPSDKNLLSIFKDFKQKILSHINGLTKTDIGLSNVDNTSDIDKPISTATQNALDKKINLFIGTELPEVSQRKDNTLYFKVTSISTDKPTVKISSNMGLSFEIPDIDVTNIKINPIMGLKIDN